MVMGELATATEVAIIGAGPGGYAAALRAAQLGKQVTLIDQEKIGGVCLHHGCIPSKALIHAADFMHDISLAHELGITAHPKIQITKLRAWKENMVAHLASGIKQLLDARHVTLLSGTAQLLGSNRIRVVSEQSSQTLQFEAAIIATGSSPVEIDGFAFDGKHVWSSTEALALPFIPKKMVIIGGGYIGLELGCAYQKLGSTVTILERGQQILSPLSPEIILSIQHHMESLGVTFLLNCSALELKKEKTLRVLAEQQGKKIILDCQAVLVAVGRRPNTRGLGLENTQSQVNEKGFLIVDTTMRTTDPSIYAIGDCAGEPMLAHKATRQAHVAAEVISGQKSAYDNLAVPSVIFTDPEIALVGKSEDSARVQGYEIAIGKFPFSASGRALTTNSPEGFVKIIADKKTNLVLGGQIVGPHASDLISELALAIEMGATAEDLALTIHPHPTFSEAIMEAALDVNHQSVHILRGESAVQKKTKRSPTKKKK